MSCKIKHLFCLSDSQIVLYWIYGHHKSQKSFVQNKVNQSRVLVDKSCSNYCSTKQNPADIVSRGIPVSKLLQISLWWNRPEFLYYNPIQWPKFEGYEEFKTHQNERTNEENSTVVVSVAKPVVNINQIIPCAKFSCFDQLIRVTSLVLKFVRILLGRIRRQCEEKVLIRPKRYG